MCPHPHAQRHHLLVKATLVLVEGASKEVSKGVSQALVQDPPCHGPQQPTLQSSVKMSAAILHSQLNPETAINRRISQLLADRLSTQRS